MKAAIGSLLGAFLLGGCAATSATTQWSLSATPLQTSADVALSDWPTVVADPRLTLLLRQEFEAEALANPLDLLRAERHSLFLLAQSLPTGLDWPAAVARLQAVQDVLRTRLAANNHVDPTDAQYQRECAAQEGQVVCELLAMVHRDQWLMSWQPENGISAEVIHPYRWALIERVRRTNAARLREMLADAGGWFDSSRSHPAAPGNAWLIIQHADHDITWQEQMLAVLRDRASRGDAEPQHVALLADRVAITRGRLQIYGSQGGCHDGTWQPLPMIDPGQVDERRAAMELEPMASYIRRFRCAANPAP